MGNINHLFKKKFTLEHHLLLQKFYFPISLYRNIIFTPTMLYLFSRAVHKLQIPISNLHNLKVLSHSNDSSESECRNSVPPLNFIIGQSSIMCFIDWVVIHHNH